MDTSQIAQRYNLVEWALDERLRRLVAAAEAKVLGHGGITAVAETTGVSRRAIHAGLKELESRQLEDKSTSSRLRRPGAGRKIATEIDTTLQMKSAFRFESAITLPEPANGTRMNTAGFPLSP